MKKNKILKLVFFIVIAIYVIYILISQQKTLNTYKSDTAYYSKKIEEANQNKENLIKIKENLNSPEYVETVAREKLGMYLPNERIYIDISK